MNTKFDRMETSNGHECIEDINKFLEVIANGQRVPTLSDNAQVYLGYIESLENIATNYFYLQYIMEAVAQDLIDKSERYEGDELKQWAEKVHQLVQLRT